MHKYFNNLTPKEHKRLVTLQEELLEAAHACSKILKHGYDNHHPDTPNISNRKKLNIELGDVRFSMIWLCNEDDLTKELIHLYAGRKAISILPYLHHATVNTSVKMACI